MQTKQTQIANIYFHINNGGIGIEVLQNEVNSFPVVTGHSPGEPVVESMSPALRISAHHFGHQTNGMEFQIRPEALRALGEALVAASERVTFENESQVVVQNPQNIVVGDEVWNKSDPNVAGGSVPTNESSQVS